MTPFYHSPSVPSFRIFYDEDDFGNYVADPNLRRPVGSSSGTCRPVDRAMNMVYVFFIFLILPVLGHYIVCIYILILSVLLQIKRVCSSAQNCGANPIPGGGNVRSEESVGTENDGTQRNENVETVSFSIALDQFCVMTYVLISPLFCLTNMVVFFCFFI
jgi:hypothetical protein